MANQRFRFSMIALLVAVAVIAASLAVIRNAGPMLAGAALTLAVFLLLFAVLGIALDRRELRKFWLGFSLFGWTYLILTCAPWFNTEVGPHLVTTELLQAIYPHIASRFAGERGAHRCVDSI